MTKFKKKKLTKIITYLYKWLLVINKRGFALKKQDHGCY